MENLRQDAIRKRDAFKLAKRNKRDTEGLTRAREAFIKSLVKLSKALIENQRSGVDTK